MCHGRQRATPLRSRADSDDDGAEQPKRKYSSVEITAFNDALVHDGLTGERQRRKYERHARIGMLRELGAVKPNLLTDYVNFPGHAHRRKEFLKRAGSEWIPGGAGEARVRDVIARIAPQLLP